MARMGARGSWAWLLTVGVPAGLWVACAEAPPPAEPGILDAGAPRQPDAIRADAGNPDAARANADADVPDAGAPAPADAGPTDAGPPIDPSYATIQGAARRADGKAFLFREREYIRFDLDDASADSGYPKSTERYWSGLGVDAIDAAFADEVGTMYFFRGDVVIPYDLAADRAQSTTTIADTFGGVWPDGVDAAAYLGRERVAFFRGRDVVRFDLATQLADPRDPSPIDALFSGVDGRRIDAALGTGDDEIHLFMGRDSIRLDLRNGVMSDRAIGCWWPGVWDPSDGTGDNSANLPAGVRDQIVDAPSPDELRARIARVVASVNSNETDVTDTAPIWVASIEAAYGIRGCRLLRRDDGGHRFRCATDTRAPVPLDIEPFTVPDIDWARGAYHVVQTSQGDFVADAKTPISIFHSDDGEFEVVSARGNPPTRGIYSGVSVRVRFVVHGVARDISFAHLDSMVPRYVIDAAESGAKLPLGTAVGFIGYTGNLGVGAPPSPDRPFRAGDRLPTAHSHIWFVRDPSNHMTLAPWARKALGFTRRYPNGGG